MFARLHFPSSPVRPAIVALIKMIILIVLAMALLALMVRRANATWPLAAPSHPNGEIPLPAMKMWTSPHFQSMHHARTNPVLSTLKMTAWHPLDPDKHATPTPMPRLFVNPIPLAPMGPTAQALQVTPFHPELGDNGRPLYCQPLVPHDMVMLQKRPTQAHTLPVTLPKLSVQWKEPNSIQRPPALYGTPLYHPYWLY